MGALRADWRSVRAKVNGRPARLAAVKGTPDLHEDWAEVKGGRYPPYGYIVRWEHPSAIVIWKMAILGKRRMCDSVFYSTRYVGILFKSPGRRIYKHEQPEDGPWDRNVLCFTREEIERSIQGHRIHHMDLMARELNRLQSQIHEIQSTAKYLAEALGLLTQDPVPMETLAALPRKVSKRIDG